MNNNNTQTTSNRSSRALNVLAVFCLIPCILIILLSIFRPQAFLDLWGIALVSLVVAIVFAVLSKLISGKN